MKLKTLQDAMAFFADTQNCIEYVVKQRWPDGKVTCPTCGSQEVRWLKSRNLFQCKTRHAKCQFSVKVGTVMEDSPLTLGHWLLIAWMLGSCRNGISSYEVSRTIGVGHKAAWFMLHRLRESMKQEGVKLFGEVEADECYIGSKPKNKHHHLRQQKPKAAVFGMVERGGRAIAVVPLDATAKSILPQIVKHVHPYSTLYTDSAAVYDMVKWQGQSYKHKVINHEQDSFAKGKVSTNRVENLWSCFKRMLQGTYIAVQPKHLGAYAAEQAFRYSHRKGFSEEARFGKVLAGTVGKRLTYQRLISRVTL